MMRCAAAQPRQTSRRPSFRSVANEGVAVLVSQDDEFAIQVLGQWRDGLVQHVRVERGECKVHEHLQLGVDRSAGDVVESLDNQLKCFRRHGSLLDRSNEFAMTIFRNELSFRAPDLGYRPL
jgi:hypothetical protein